MPELDKPVRFTHKVKRDWDAFWDMLPNEERLSLPEVWEDATPARPPEWWHLVPGHSYWCYYEFPGWMFTACIGTGKAEVIGWACIDERPDWAEVKRSRIVEKAKRRVANFEKMEAAKAEARSILAAIPQAVAHVPEVVSVVLPPLEVPDLEGEELRLWLKSELAKVHERLADGPEKAERKALIRRIDEITTIQRRLKSSVRAIAAAEDTSESDQLLPRADGTGNIPLLPVVRYLLRSVKEMQAEIRQLKGIA